MVELRQDVRDQVPGGQVPRVQGPVPVHGVLLRQLLPRLPAPQHRQILHAGRLLNAGLAQRRIPGKDIASICSSFSFYQLALILNCVKSRQVRLEFYIGTREVFKVKIYLNIKRYFPPKTLCFI